MYAIIFRAEMNEVDDTYADMASHLRDLAMNHYGCVDFTALTEGNQEIAISYWNSREQINAWKNDPIHKRAQELGQTRWYKSYTVQMVEVMREYKKEALQNV